MRVLGIDPGTATMGYGLVEIADNELALVEYGALTIGGSLPMADRLLALYSRLAELIARHKPSVLAIEEPFVARNVRSALAVGQARAVALLAAANAGLPVHGYTPAQVKLSVTDYGRSSKEQVQEMVRLQLRLPAVPQPDDAADALAVAICHIWQSRLGRILANNG